MAYLERKNVLLSGMRKLNGIYSRPAIIAISIIWILLLSGTYFRISNGAAKPYVKNQWYNFYLLTGAFDSFNVPLILFDTEVLPKVAKPRREIWHDPAYTCNVLCKHHPDGNNLITFAVLGHKFIPEQQNIVTRLQKVGFATHLSLINDRKLHGTEEPVKIPSYLWIARKDHVIHIVILHDRHDDYYWAGPVIDTDWTTTVTALKPQMTIDWQTLNGAVFPRYAQGYDKSYHLAGVSTKIDSHEFIVPYRITAFLREHEESRFIECDQKVAETFFKKFLPEKTSQDVNFQNIMKHSLRIARKVLNKLSVPFWISSDTLLGWYRQCDIISNATAISIGIRIHDFRPDIIDEMEKKGLMLRHINGKQDDSYSISLIDLNHVELSIIFFYDENNYSWHGRTRTHDGAKFQFIYPKFTLCWAEFLSMKLRIPCETTSYIEANYGQHWKTPLKQWVWYASPPNVIPNGYWDKQEWDEVIQVFRPIASKKLKEKDL